MGVPKWFNKVLLFISILISALLISCTRVAKEEGSKISLSIPEYMKSQKMGALAFDSLIHVSINITGGGISVPIVFNWDRESNSSIESAPESFTLEVARGTDRLIQVLAVYGSSGSSGGGAMQFYYGDVIRTFSADSEEVAVALNSVGQGTTIISGRIQGRYLTSASDGPTGPIDIVYVPPGGKSPMIVERSMIMNGWFQFFGLMGAQLGYRLQDGSFLWGGPVDLTETSFPVSNQVMRVVVPIHLRNENYSGTTSVKQEDPSIYIYGFFGDAASVSSKAICKLTSGNPLTNLFKIGTTTVLTIADNNSADPSNLFDTSLSAVNIRGGVALGGSAPCDTQANITANLYTSAQSFKPNLLENGNDNSAGFSLPFQLATSSNNNGGSNSLTSTVVDVNNISLSGTLLPGIANTLDAFAVYKAINLGSDFHYHSSFASCEALLGMQYTLIATTPLSGSNYTATLPLTDAEASSGAMFALCPLKAGAPAGLGFWVQASYLRGYGGCNNCGGGGGGGNVGGGTPTAIAIQDLTAITQNQCSYVNVSLLTSSNSSAATTSSVTINLSVTGGGTFYAQGDYNCAGGAVTSAVIPANSSWVGLNFKSAATPETNITLNASDASSVLTAASKTIRVRSVGSAAQLNFGTYIQAANVGSCIAMSVNSVETNGSVVSYGGTVSVTGYGIQVYSDSSCNTLSSNFNFSAGISSFYVKSTTVGWANLQANATIDGLNFSAYHGMGIYASGEPTHLVLGSPSPSYLFINQCMPITVTSKDDANIAVPLPASQVVKFSSSGAGAGNNFYTDPNCTSSMVNYETNFLGGQSAITIYFKPQNYGNISLNTYINGNNYYISGNQNYNIGNLWMHVLVSGFNGSWYDSTCGTLTFQLMDASTAGGANVVLNLSGSPISVGVNTNRSISEGGLYSASDCSDAVASAKGTSIASGASSSTIYMKSLLAAGNYVSVFPTYSGSYSSIYQNGNTLTVLSYAWCPPLDGGGACPSSLSFSGPGVAGGSVGYSPAVTVGIPTDKTITITDVSGSGVTLSTFTITGGQAADYSFKGGSYPGTGGTCTGAISPSGSCTVVVTFTPSAIGGRYAYLNVNYNSTSIPLALQGTGQ